MLLDLCFNKSRTVAEHYWQGEAASLNFIPNPPTAAAIAPRDFSKRYKMGRFMGVWKIF
jgi:hypothetical protein